jgi:ribosomal protein S18 acetylase RimI-like enzyme
MIIRVADLADLNQCCELDGSYTTEYVWQMQAHENERTFEVRFDTVRLPRAMKVAYPRHPDERLANWRQGESFVDMAVQRWHAAGWVRNLIVHPGHRQRGVGSALLRAARYWAIDNDLSKIMFETQTKNYPAIHFAQKHRFIFCGYNDRYYSNGDIAVFFSLTV